VAYIQCTVVGSVDIKNWMAVLCGMPTNPQYSIRLKARGARRSCLLPAFYDA